MGNYCRNTRYNRAECHPQFPETLCRVTMRSFSCLLLVVFIFSTLGAVVAERSDGVLDKIKAGLQYATNYLEKAKDIADLVSQSLGRKQKEKRGEDSDENAGQTFGTSNIVSAFFRLFGLDSSKVTAIAVNSVIFLAQMISSLFDLKPPKANIGRNLESDGDEPPWDPLEYILQNRNERVQNLVEQAQNEDLPNQLIDRVDGIDSACIRLLLCKTSPVIRAAQNSLKNKTQDGFRRIISWLPSRDEFEANSDKCEDHFIDCNLFSES